ncbi:hypothetical protein M422DRAFT_275949, partial [Sphaerobolus stellatus SS14]
LSGGDEFSKVPTGPARPGRERTRTNARGARGGGSVRRGGPRAPRVPKKEPTAEELDKELETFMGVSGGKDNIANSNGDLEMS